ncbi:MAG: rRNA maturation RNase YbeY [Bacteroidota bacterium]
MAKNKQKQDSLPCSTSQISFNFIDMGPFLRNRKEIRRCIILCINKENKTPGEITFNFCSDKRLLKMNKNYLKHDFYTDIITFDFSENNLISGDIYISKERVKENAAELNDAFHVELKRVMVHGVLHLCGYKDKTRAEKEKMRKKEDECLSLLR